MKWDPQWHDLTPMVWARRISEVMWDSEAKARGYVWGVGIGGGEWLSKVASRENKVVNRVRWGGRRVVARIRTTQRGVVIAMVGLVEVGRGEVVEAGMQMTKGVVFIKIVGEHLRWEEGVFVR